MKCNLCQSHDCKLIKVFTKKPPKETDFKLKNYHREVYFCNNCEVYFNHHKFDMEKIYSGKYNKDTYDNKILENYNKIMNYPFEISCNKHRVERIVKFINKPSKVLDIGSGLCVFLGQLKKYRYDCYFLDPDETSFKHGIENVGVKGFKSSLKDLKTDIKFDLITLNNVIEHSKEPLRMLEKAKNLLKDDGIMYIEVPFAKIFTKLNNQSGFDIAHYYIFTDKSIKFLLDKANLKVLNSGITDIANIYTFYAFLKKKRVM